jgi:hypothetical protein
MAYRNRDWPGKLDILRQERGYQCEVEHNGHRCYAKGELEFAHIKPSGLSGRSRGQSRRYYDIKKNPECYKLMCKYHHNKFDREYWRNLQKETENEPSRTSSESDEVCISE